MGELDMFEAESVGDDAPGYTPAFVSAPSPLAPATVVAQAGVPTQALGEILDLAAQRLAQIKEGEGFFGNLLAPDKWGPAQRELDRLRKQPDGAAARVQARSLLTSLGGELPGTPAAYRGDAGDTAAMNKTVSNEVDDQIALLRGKLPADLEGWGLPRWLPWAGGAALLTAGGLALRRVLS